MFRLSKEAERWFRHIRKHESVKLDFDVYYFCLMAGLASEKKLPLPSTESKDIILNFPKEYKNESKIVISLFLKTELKKQGVSLEDRKTVHKVIRRYIDPVMGLNEEGKNTMNKYSNGGFRELQDYFIDIPQTMEVFLIRYSQFIDQECKKRFNNSF